MYVLLTAVINLITTVHGTNLEDIKKRPVLRDIIEIQLFERFVVLSRSEGVGTLEEVIDGTTEEYLFQRKQGRGESIF